jgi:hypothetical protein
MELDLWSLGLCVTPVWYARVAWLYSCLFLPCPAGLLWNVGLLVFFGLLQSWVWFTAACESVIGRSLGASLSCCG